MSRKYTLKLYNNGFARKSKDSWERARARQEERIEVPRILLAAEERGASVEYRPSEQSEPVHEIRVQFPIEGEDYMVHIVVSKRGKVKVATRPKRWADKPHFTKIQHIDVKNELMMQRLAK